jgi:hypothetical protein
LVRAGEPDLLAEVRSRLATSEPLDLLVEASVFLAALDPRSRSPFDRTASRDEASASLDELVRTFPEVDRIETSALLAGIAQLAPDGLFRAQARRYLAITSFPSGSDISATRRPTVASGWSTCSATGTT